MARAFISTKYKDSQSECRVSLKVRKPERKRILWLAYKGTNTHISMLKMKANNLANGLLRV